MDKQVEIYEMQYSCSPGGVDCWETTIQGYEESSTASDCKTAGKALDWVINKYPNDILKIRVMSLQVYDLINAE